MRIIVGLSMMLMLGSALLSLSVMGILITRDTLSCVLCGPFAALSIYLENPTITWIFAIFSLISVSVFARKRKVWWIPASLWPVVGCVILNHVLTRAYIQ